MLQREVLANVDPLARGMKLLVVAPEAPPKNSPEAMQVGRYLGGLTRTASVTLVTTKTERGWVKADESLLLDIPGLHRITLALPFHDRLKRLLAKLPLSAVTVPDADAWLAWRARAVAERLQAYPDVIYSRSFPLSAALLGATLARLLGAPWVMHLSDPWADNPYRQLSARRAAIDGALERRCFAAADAITLTSDGFRDFYAWKYPQWAEKLAVTANVMPALRPITHTSPRLDPADRIHLVHTGAFYGQRRPLPLILGYRRLFEMAPDLARRLQLWFVGNMSAAAKEDLRACPEMLTAVTGPLGYGETRMLQEHADALLSIEPPEDHPLLKSVLLSKMVDYLAVRRPIFALAPEGSVSAALCARGFGWTADPRRPGQVAEILAQIVSQAEAPVLPEPPEEYTLSRNLSLLEEVFTSVACRRRRR